MDFKKIFEKSMNEQKNKVRDLTNLTNAADNGIETFKKTISSDIKNNTVKNSYNIASLDNATYDCQTLMSIVDYKLKVNGITNYKIRNALFGDLCIVTIGP